MTGRKGKLNLERMTEAGRVNLILEGLRGPNGVLRASALGFLLKKRRMRQPTHRTFTGVESHIVNSDLIRDYNSFLNSIPDWKNVEKYIKSRGRQIHTSLHQMQSISYSHTGRPFPLYKWLEERGMTNILPRQHEEILHMAEAHTRVSLLLEHYIKHGMVEIYRPRLKTDVGILEYKKGGFPLPPEWELKLRFTRELRVALRRFWNIQGTIKD